MKILHTESSLGWGGQENRTLNEALALRARGFDFAFLVQPGARLGERAEEAGFRVHRVPMGRGLALGSLIALRRVIASERPDIVNTHSGRDTLLAMLAARSLWNRPRLLRTRHLILPPTHLSTYTWLPDHVVTVSEAVRADLLRRGVPAGHVTAVPSAVDLARFDPARVQSRLREELGLSPDALLVGTVAILRNRKGHRDLLDAIPRVLAEASEVHFVIAGDGPQEANLRRIIAERGLRARVHLLGLRRDVPEVLAALDIFVLPTHQEALGTAFLEAQAMGVPVIGTRVGGVPETVDEGRTGLLVPPHAPEALAAAILDLIKNVERRRAMATAARAWVSQRFGIEAMADGMEHVYRRLVGGHA